MQHDVLTADELADTTDHGLNRADDGVRDRAERLRDLEDGAGHPNEILLTSQRP